MAFDYDRWLLARLALRLLYGAGSGDVGVEEHGGKLAWFGGHARHRRWHWPPVSEKRAIANMVKARDKRRAAERSSPNAADRREKGEKKKKKEKKEKQEDQSDNNDPHGGTHSSLRYDSPCGRRATVSSSSSPPLLWRPQPLVLQVAVHLRRGDITKDHPRFQTAEAVVMSLDSLMETIADQAVLLGGVERDDEDDDPDVTSRRLERERERQKGATVSGSGRASDTTGRVTGARGADRTPLLANQTCIHIITEAKDVDEATGLRRRAKEEAEEEDAREDALFVAAAERWSFTAGVHGFQVRIHRSNKRGNGGGELRHGSKVASLAAKSKNPSFDTFESLEHLIAADILVVGDSSFGQLAALYSNGIALRTAHTGFDQRELLRILPLPFGRPMTR